MTRSPFRIASLLLTVVLFPSVAVAEEASLSFNRDVRPILAAKCFACHGPDEESRQAELRLDRRENAIAEHDGIAAIRPGKPETSELVSRILADDEFAMMPPPEANHPLTPTEIETLTRWVREGAEYETHWAFVPPARPAVPTFENDRWSRTPIDRFVLRRLREANLTPAPEADRYTLIRRLSLDLTGLPPTIAETDAFVNDDRPDAYTRLVDRLLASPAYGERFAIPWLDLARYADTNGYEKDRPRSIWPYRDYVIDALNEDMPFDRFTIEQLAGDMLPDATPRQRIATGFHRNTMMNEEGGIDPLEFRFYSMVDRVATTGTVWLGLSTGCAQCHTHKYDPITHTDYFRLMALLNNADEPNYSVPNASVEAERERIERQIVTLEQALPEQFPRDGGTGSEAEQRRRHLETAFAGWLAAERERAFDWTVLRPVTMTTNLPRLEVLPDGSIFSTGDITKRDEFHLSFQLPNANELDGRSVTGLRLEVLPDERLPGGGPGRTFYEGRLGDFFLSDITAETVTENDRQPLTFRDANASYGKLTIGSGGAKATNVLDGDGSTGWSTAGRNGKPDRLVLTLAEPLAPGSRFDLHLLFERHFAASLGRFRIAFTTAPVAGKSLPASPFPSEIEALLATDADNLTAAEHDRLRETFLRTTPLLADARKPIDALRRQLPTLPQTLVMRERPKDNPRPTFRHHRGEYLSPKERVDPALPSLFVSEGESSGKAIDDRLAFAEWLVGEGNPLVGRVVVNRAWREFFGAGLMRSGGDFGTQSDIPTHPELLDWLAVEVRERDWSLKQLHRLIVTSSVYRQRSHTDASVHARDPENRLLARGPRFRMPGELVRDTFLTASGRLTHRLGGPSVFPPQPGSVTALAYGNSRWNVSTGPDRFRRSLYTFRKRTAPFAASSVFDGPSGESCIVVRNRSNTPLQSLTLLNDAMFLEFARHLAAVTAGERNTTPEARLNVMFRRVLTRPPTEFETETLLAFHARQRERLTSGELKPQPITSGIVSDTPDEAAWVLVARVLMNLDEAISKP